MSAAGIAPLSCASLPEIAEWNARAVIVIGMVASSQSAEPRAGRSTRRSCGVDGRSIGRDIATVGIRRTKVRLVPKGWGSGSGVSRCRGNGVKSVGEAPHPDPGSNDECRPAGCSIATGGLRACEPARHVYRFAPLHNDCLRNPAFSFVRPYLYGKGFSAARSGNASPGSIGATQQFLTPHLGCSGRKEETGEGS